MAGSYRAQDADQTPVEGARILRRFERGSMRASSPCCGGARLLRWSAPAPMQPSIEVPGALEIAPAALIALDVAEMDGSPYDGVVALGCVIRGDTYHFEIVANESARGLTDLSLSRALPLGNGILTVDNEQQAILRADPAQGDKGGEAAHAALSLVRLARSMRG